ncbi:MAG: hypothetical protein JWL83_94 [Actinomycetia bacterium]|nr:hypothetical protein [Actinomycetes bacterium]
MGRPGYLSNRTAPRRNTTESGRREAILTRRGEPPGTTQGGERRAQAPCPRRPGNGSRRCRRHATAIAVTSALTSARLHDLLAERRAGAQRTAPTPSNGFRPAQRSSSWCRTAHDSRVTRACSYLVSGCRYFRTCRLVCVRATAPVATSARTARWRCHESSERTAQTGAHQSANVAPNTAFATEVGGESRRTRHRAGHRHSASVRAAQPVPSSFLKMT